MTYNKEENMSTSLKRLIMEMPIEYPATVGDAYNFPEYNLVMAKNIEKKYKYLGSYIYLAQEFKLYKETNENIVSYALLINAKDNNDYMGLIFDLEEVTINNIKGLRSISVIRSRLVDISNFHHLALDFLFKYLIKNFNFITSDWVHTFLGKRFWENIIDNGIEGGYYLYAYNSKNEDCILLNDKNNQNIDDFYEKDKKEYRFIISNVKLC